MSELRELEFAYDKGEFVLRVQRADEINQQCGVLVLRVNNGLVTVVVAALQTDNVAIISKGQVDLATEAIDLGFRTKQRRGLGLSVGAIINPYVRLSGTLANPTWRLDKKSGAVAGSAAFFTGGLSILAQVVWDRYLSSGNVCDAALKRNGIEFSFAAGEEFPR